MRSPVGSMLAGALLLTCAVVAQDKGTRDRALPHYKIGWENMRAEDFPKAVIAFEQAIEIDPAFEMAYYQLGRAHMAQKKFPAAAAAFVKSRDLYVAQA